MGLFAIATVAQAIVTNKQFQSALISVSSQGINKLVSLFDSNGDGSFNEDEFNNLLEYANMIASILGHAAIVDGIVQEKEREVASNLLEHTCFDVGGIFNVETLKIGKFNKDELKKQLIGMFYNPYPLKKIAKYAIEKELEDNFYEFSCIIVSADEEIRLEERDFLDELKNVLGLSKFDVVRIENKILKLMPKKRDFLPKLFGN